MLQLYCAFWFDFLRYSLPVISVTCPRNLRAIQGIQAQALHAWMQTKHLLRCHQSLVPTHRGKPADFVGWPGCVLTAATILVVRDLTLITHVTTQTLRLHIKFVTKLPFHDHAELPQSRPRSSLSAIVVTRSAEVQAAYLSPHPLRCGAWQNRRFASIFLELGRKRTYHPWIWNILQSSFDTWNSGANLLLCQPPRWEQTPRCWRVLCEGRLTLCLAIIWPKDDRGLFMGRLARWEAGTRARCLMCALDVSTAT